MNNLVVTDLGKNLVARLVAGETAMQFTKVSTSSANYKGVELETLTELSDVKQTVNAASMVRVDNERIEVVASIENVLLEAGYYIRAVGLYAKGDDNVEVLYGIAIDPDTPDYIPTFDNQTLTAVEYKLSTVITNADTVNVTVAGADVPSMDAFNDLVQRVVEIEEALPPIIERLDGHDAEILSVETRVGTVETEVSSVGTDVTEVLTRIGSPNPTDPSTASMFGYMKLLEDIGSGGGNSELPIYKVFNSNTEYTIEKDGKYRITAWGTGGTSGIGGAGCFIDERRYSVGDIITITASGIASCVCAARGLSATANAATTMAGATATGGNVANYTGGVGGQNGGAGGDSEGCGGGGGTAISPTGLGGRGGNGGIVGGAGGGGGTGNYGGAAGGNGGNGGIVGGVGGVGGTATGGSGGTGGTGGAGGILGGVGGAGGEKGTATGGRGGIGGTGGRGGILGGVGGRGVNGGTGGVGGIFGGTGGYGTNDGGNGGYGGRGGTGGIVGGTGGGGVATGGRGGVGGILGGSAYDNGETDIGRSSVYPNYVFTYLHLAPNNYAKYMRTRIDIISAQSDCVIIEEVI